MSTEFYNRNWRMPNSFNGSEDNNSKFSNYSMSFDGSTNSISLPEVIYSGAFTFSFWVNPDTLGGLDFIAGDINSNAHFIWIQSSTVIKLKTNGSIYTFTESAGNDITINSWQPATDYESL